MNRRRRVLSKEETVDLGWERSVGEDGLEPTCPVCRLFAPAAWSDNSCRCLCGWKPGDWPRTPAEQAAFRELVAERACSTFGDVHRLFKKERERHQTVILNLPSDETQAPGTAKAAPAEIRPVPRLLGRAFSEIDAGDWWMPLGLLDVGLHEHTDGSWEWVIGDSTYEGTDLEDCLANLRRELRFLQRELGLDEHQQTGIDAYAIHLGQQAASGLILAHETQWLEEYDRRRIHERKVTR